MFRQTAHVYDLIYEATGKDSGSRSRRCCSLPRCRRCKAMPSGHPWPGGGYRSAASRTGEGNIAIGGATLDSRVAAPSLIDEYRARVNPVLVGGGTPFFPSVSVGVDLELVETRTFGSRVVHLRYRVAR
jgi:RibD C-terminal domain